MGLIIFALLAVLEIMFACWTCTKGKEKRVFRKSRLILRIIEAAIACIALLLPFGQKWRFVPLLIFLALMLVIAALIVLIRRNRPERARKPASAIALCVVFILVCGLFLTPAFLFTGYKGLPVSGQYRIGEASAILIDRSRTDPFEQDGTSREVPVHFYYPEGNDTGTDQFPLLVFSHGAFCYYQSNTSTYMELASNGYVVVSLDHPHHAFFTQDTDGRTILADREFLNEAMNLNNEMAPEKQFALYTEWMALRTADMNFAVDELKLAGRQDALDDSWFLADADADRIQAILQRTDFSKIGLMGHSMGGATSVALGRERNDISAVIDIDGTMLSEYTGVENGELIVREEAYDCPVLEFINWESYNDQREYRAQGGRYPNDILMQQAAAGFTTTIRDTGHMDFTDLPLLSPFLGNMLGSGERDTAETMTIVNSLVLQFFNCYLKGEGTFSIEEVY